MDRSPWRNPDWKQGYTASIDAVVNTASVAFVAVSRICGQNNTHVGRNSQRSATFRVSRNCMLRNRDAHRDPGTQMRRPRGGGRCTGVSMCEARGCGRCPSAWRRRVFAQSIHSGAEKCRQLSELGGDSSTRPPHSGHVHVPARGTVHVPVKSARYRVGSPDVSAVPAATCAPACGGAGSTTARRAVRAVMVGATRIRSRWLTSPRHAPLC